MIDYRDSLEGIKPEHLVGFFEGWPNPPSPKTHLRLLEQSDEFVVALDPSSGSVVGFVTAITDRVLSAYIPLLEVVTTYRGRGIGRELVARLLEKLGPLYMIDLMCDPELETFYRRLGFQSSHGMIIRRRDAQAGAKA
jgi:ribosomal protein S18 acetylase RimI-like enzyme